MLLKIWRSYLTSVYLVLMIAVVSFVSWSDSTVDAASNYWNAHWYAKWGLLLFGMILFLAYRIAYRIHWSLFLPIVSTVGGAVWVAAWRDNQYVGWDIMDLLAFGKGAANVGLAYCIFLLFFLSVPRTKYELLEKCFAWLCLIDAAYVIYQACTGYAPFFRAGFFGNASMNGCLIAFTYPFLNFKKPWQRGLKLHEDIWRVICVLLPVIAVILPGRSMPLGVLFVVLATFFIPRAWRRFGAYYTLGLVLLFSALCFVSGYAFLSVKLWDNSGRFHIWIIAMRWWAEHSNPWFGTGPGMAMLLIPHIQILHHHLFGTWYIWFHNDILQSLFEGGLFAFVGYGLLCASVVWRARRTPYLLCAVMGWVATATANYPCHLSLHAFIGAFLVFATLRGRRGLG